MSEDYFKEEASDGRQKVALFIGSDITAHLVLNRIIPDMLDAGFRPVIFLPKHKANERAQLPELKELAFYERELPNKIIYPYLQEHFARRANNLSPKQLANYHADAGVKLFEIEDVNAPEFVERTKAASNYAGAISIRCFQIFKRPMIDVFKEKGFFLNLHPGTLPQYRGVMSVHRAMADKALTGEPKTYGWTLHEIDEGIDTGDVLFIKAREIDLSKSALELTLEMAPLGAKAIVQAMEELDAGNVLQGYPQVHEQASYFTYPTSEELKIWQDNGVRLFNPESIACTLTGLFSDPTSKHGKGLKDEIRKAIADRHQQLRHTHSKAANGVGNGTGNSSEDGQARDPSNRMQLPVSKSNSLGGFIKRALS